MNSDTIEQRFEQLEEKLAYQEMTNAELSEEIFRQQKEIDTLTLAHQSMVQRMEALQDVAALTACHIARTSLGNLPEYSVARYV